MNKILHIVEGINGTGKTTFVKELCDLNGFKSEKYVFPVKELKRIENLTTNAKIEDFHDIFNEVKAFSKCKIIELHTFYNDHIDIGYLNDETYVFDRGFLTNLIYSLSQYQMLANKVLLQEPDRTMHFISYIMELYDFYENQVPLKQDITHLYYRGKQFREKDDVFETNELDLIAKNLYDEFIDNKYGIFKLFYNLKAFTFDSVIKI